MTLTRRSVALLVLAAFLALLNLGGARDVAVVEELPDVSAVLPDQVAVLQISTPIEKLRIERVSTEKGSAEFDRWRIVTPLQFPADAAQVRTLLRVFAPGLPMDAFIDSGNHDDYGVDDQNGLLVELFRPGEDVPAAAMVVGKAASGPSAFVRLPGAEDVYRADVGGRAKYARPAGEWRDKVAFEADAAAIVELELTRGAERLSFARGPSTGVDADGNPLPGPWQLAGAPFDTDTDTVDATLRTLARIRAGEVHNPDYEAGFDAPAAVARLALSDGSSRTITLGGRQIEGAALLRVDGRDEVFRVAGNVGRVMSQPIEAFRDRRLLRFERADIDAIAYADRGLTVVLSQVSDDNWAITQPPNMDADQRLARFAVNTLAGLRAAAIPADTAFSPSGARFEVRFRDGRTETLEFGQAERDADNRPLVRARVTGKPGVFLLQQTTYAELRKAFGRG